MGLCPVLERSAKNRSDEVPLSVFTSGTAIALNFGLRQLGCGLPSHVYLDDNEDCREDRLLDHSMEPCGSLDKRIDPNSDK